MEVSGALQRVESAKYTAPLSETPQTIQVIPRALLDEQGATTLSDALRNVPGITMQAGEGGGASNTTGDMFNMRGFSANNSLFVDDVRDDGLRRRATCSTSSRSKCSPGRPDRMSDARTRRATSI